LRSKALEHQLFYFPPDSLRDGVIVFARDESRHMVRSLRLAAGDWLRATDGAGRFYDAVLERTVGPQAEARVRATVEVAAPVPSVTIYQGVVRPQRMDFLIEKAAELGCAGLVPVECARSVRRVARPRLARWRRLAREAMKQSRRAHLTEISEPMDFRAAAAGSGDFDLVLLARGDPSAGPLVKVMEASAARAALWIGPEGGFTDEEVEGLQAAGARPFSLGPYRLRSETAALAALAAIAAISPNSL